MVELCSWTEGNLPEPESNLPFGESTQLQLSRLQALERELRQRERDRNWELERDKENANLAGGHSEVPPPPPLLQVCPPPYPPGLAEEPLLVRGAQIGPRG